MDSSGSCGFDIFQIYRSYCDIISGNACICVEKGCQGDEKLQSAKVPREGLGQLLKLAESRVNTGFSIFDELWRLMLRLDLMVDFSEFSRFYDFVFFMCRENGQKNMRLKLYPGSLKRKSQEDSIRHELELSDSRFCDSIDLKDGKSNPKRSKQRFMCGRRDLQGSFRRQGSFVFSL